MALKRKIIDKFRDQPYYCASNYRLYSKSHGTECLLSINSMFMCVQFDITLQYIFLENIINIAPYERHLMVRYYDKDIGKVEELSFSTRDKQSVWVIMDFLSYCTIRIKTPNMFLYLQRELYSQLIKHSLPMTIFDYETTMNTSIVAKKVSVAKEGLPQSTIDELVNLFQRNLKRLEKLEIVVETGREYAFQHENLFVKTYINRLQYPYRAGRKLDLCEPLGPKPKHIDQKNRENDPVLRLENKNSVEPQSPLPAPSPGLNPLAQLIASLSEKEPTEVTSPTKPPPRQPDPSNQATVEKPPPAPPTE